MVRFLFLFLFLMSCSGVEKKNKIKNYIYKNERVRLTVYWKEGSGSDMWTRQGISSTGEKLINKASVAVDPSFIPYGSEVLIPELGISAVAVDTGTAVINKIASIKMGENFPVVDLFFENKKDAIIFSKESPLFVDVDVIENKG